MENRADETTTRDQKQTSFIPPSIALPKGGGAIRGMVEKFAANPVTGTGSMTVPIATSPGRSDFGPLLALSYDSGAGNGPFGFGWSLSLPNITRKSDKGLPRYDDVHESDVFILSGAEDLVPVLVETGTGWERERPTIHLEGAETYRVERYRPRIEGLFARIERWTNVDDPADVHWRSISKDNVLTLYGRDENSRITDPADRSHIFTWLICETRDDKGNGVLYEYQAEDGRDLDLTLAHEANRGDEQDNRRQVNRYLKRIYCGNRKTLLVDGRRPPFLTQAQIGGAGWMFEVVFDYDEGHVFSESINDDQQTFVEADIDATHDWKRRQDPFSSYRAGFEVRTNRLCQRVLMFHHFPDELGVDNYLVRSTDFTYSNEQDENDARNPIYSFLLSVSHCGYVRQGTKYLRRCLPPLEFEYSPPIVQTVVEEVDAESLENLPVGLDGEGYRWIDLHGEGIPGVLTEQAGAWFYKRNTSPINLREYGDVRHVEAQFAPTELVATKPNASLGGGAQFMDLAGDGQPDLVVLDGPLSGLYEHDGEMGWTSFRPFAARLNRAMADPNLRFVDLDGDGYADVLITEHDALVWHASLGEEGFGPAQRVGQVLDEERGPRLVFADGTQSVYLADLSGDGLADLARVRNGEVCYWPNLGYGRFGARVTMDGSPWFDAPDQFDQARIRLADVDGSGTTDILYLHGDGVRLYFNQAGNSWSQAQHLAVFPRVDNLVDIQVTDLLGNGTACLVWSSPLPGDGWRRMRYVNLMGNQKPHLLVRTVNNLGAETRVHYAPSTRFYLQDRRDGKPWITRLPFPVHVVERVETYDHISRNRFVTTYAYHHGYFDGEEREFRGFGMVERLDTELFAALAKSGELPVGDNVDAASHVPPVLTRSWFHTGVYLGRDRVSRYLAGLADENDRGEYYREPAWLDDDVEAEKHMLADTVLPEDLSVAEEREAARGLKGTMLRQEVYALDGVGQDKDYPYGQPYTVAEQNMAVRLVQGRGPNRHAVFFTHPLEAVTYHYERDAADPRVQHAMTLEVDEFGNVLKSSAIGYGRRERIRVVDEHGDAHEIANPELAKLDLPDREKQTSILITYTENRVTNAIDRDDDYRTPLPAESRMYELTGLKPENDAARFGFDEWTRDNFSLPATLPEIHYEQVANHNSRQKRLIEQVRSLYRKDDLSALLALGELESLALPGESYKLAFTPGLLDQIYVRNGQKLLPANRADILKGGGADRGGYVLSQDLKAAALFPNSDPDDHWWIPTGRVFFSPGPVTDPADELAFARAHFFLPHRYRDPFHTNGVSTESTVTFDGHNLLILETRDTLGNTVQAQNDYRVLAPRLMIDPNGNRAQVAFDALGMVAGTAVTGKRLPAPGEGDSLEGFVPDPTLADLDVFIAQPRRPSANPQESEVIDIVRDLLGNATTRIVYDLDRFSRLGEPPFAATIVRETHVSDLRQNEQSKLQVSFSYSDGFGREIQKKIQAEPGPLVEGGPDVNPRWVGSGWTVFNNKGKPVRQYEPFFSPTHDFEFGVEVGVSPVLFYDPAERVIATLHPNHTFEKVVFDPWQQITYDVNDTSAPRPAQPGDPRPPQTGDPRTDPDIGGYVAEYFKALLLVPAQPWQTWHAQRIGGALGPHEQTAAARAAAHANTPTTAHFDTLGRPFLTEADNGPDPARPDRHLLFATRVELDIEGNQRAVIDAKDRVVMCYDYDLLGNRIHQASMEAGERWTLNDVVGKPIRAWDSRGFARRMTYDALRRPIGLYVTDPAGERLAERTDYGEDKPSPEATNHRGKVWQLRDGAGIVTSEAYDFKGNLLSSKRDLRVEYKIPANWAQQPEPVTTESFPSSTTYDALDRSITVTTPDKSVYRPAFNEANLLEKVAVELQGAAVATPFVTDIDYNAKGQREQIVYANGAQTTYEYDPLTFRLTRLRTTRPADVHGLAAALFVTITVVQDLHYTYDPAGNITRIEDAALKTVSHANQTVKPIGSYVYDAAYRLIEANGREHIGQTAFDFTPPNGNRRDYPFMALRANPNDPEALRNYTETYAYDAVGNFNAMGHAATGGNWTRTYVYNEDSLTEAGKKSNRLTRTEIGNGINQAEAYTYDAHGNMTAINTMGLAWDFEDQLTEVDLGGGGTAYYAYDAAGQRVRKVIENQNGTPQEERIYLGGHEIYRQHTGAHAGLVRETLHVMDDRQRIALVETRNAVNDGTRLQLIRYQFGNHLGSASLELDDQAQIISYEEYAPYGSTSYQAVRSQTETAKRYRYTGKERDEESGLYYHGARYYAPWLGRWVSCDPAGLVDGANLYHYASGNPTTLVDLHGTTPCDPESASCYTPSKLETPDPNQSAPANIIIRKPGVRPMYEQPKLSLDPPPPPPKPDTSPGGFTQAAVTSAGQKIEAKIRDVVTLPSKLAEPYRELHQAYEEGGIVGLVTAGFDAAGAILKRPPIVALAEIAKGVGEDIAIVQESTEKIASTSDPEAAGKQTVEAGSALLSIATTIFLPEEGAAEKGLLKQAALATRPSHVYELRWRNLATGETGGYKYGMSSGRVTAQGTSYRANRQINQWNKDLRLQGFELYHGELWGRGYNQMNLDRAQAFWAEQYKVSEHFQLTGAPPIGNQSPLPWGGVVIPPPPP